MHTTARCQLIGWSRSSAIASIHFSAWSDDMAAWYDVSSSWLTWETKANVCGSESLPRHGSGEHQGDGEKMVRQSPDEKQGWPQDSVMLAVNSVTARIVDSRLSLAKSPNPRQRLVGFECRLCMAQRVLEAVEVYC